jgi:TonB-linked SusC/RagA family outer membrane protein
MLLGIIVHAQTRSITGQVVSSDNSEPLIGVTVSVKGTSAGGATDVNGKFSINVPQGQAVTLTAKYLGYTDQDVAVSATQANVTIRLVPSSTALNEVVVIGFGQTVRRRDLTGSVASVKAEDIVRTPTTTALEAIQGRAPGVDITRTSGVAGSGANISIRGNRTISGSRGPLYVVDGVQGVDINTINPNDIESIDVLKDASSIAVYGSQGANGVVVVTTKRGIAGKTQVSYNAYYGVNGFTEYPEVRTGEDYVALRREALRANNVADYNNPALLFPLPAELAAYQSGQWVDWVDQVIRNGSQQNHALSVRSGTENTKVFLSAGYFKEEGPFRNNDFNRYNVRFNLDQNLSKWAKAGLQSQYTYSNLDNRRDPLSVALTTSPLGSVYDANGNINVYPLANTTNVSPLSDERPYAAVDNVKGTNMVISPYLEITPFKGLSFRSNFSATLTNSRRGVFNDASSLAQNNVKYTAASITNTTTRFYNWDNILRYNTQFGKHSLTATAITSYTNNENEILTASGTRQLLSSQLFYNLGSTEATSRVITSPYVLSNTMAYVGRVDYNYGGKYLLTANARYDGASRLSPGKKWDVFPSVALGWILSEESFMKNINFINNFKLRGSYGVAGNSGIEPYGTQNGISPASIILGNVANPIYTINPLIGNADLGWEKSYQLNIGADVSLLKNRINITADWYNTTTKGILYSRNLPPSTGVGTVYENIAETNNKGIELSINTTNIRSKAFTWSSNLTFTHNNEKITKLVDGKDIINSENNSLLLGHPIASYYTYDKLGIWQLNDPDIANVKFGTTAYQPGDIKVWDADGNGIINTNDRTYVGANVPKFVAGLQNNFSYKNIDLGVFLFARYGQTINAEFLGRYNPGGTGNGPAFFDYWTPENPTNDYPRPKQGAVIGSINGYQALNYVDGSYFKIKNISLGYTFPTAFAQKLHVQKLRFYATGANIFTATKSHLLKYYDPERGGAESSPLSKQFVFGVNLDL